MAQTDPNSPLEELLDVFRTFRCSGAHGYTWPSTTICVVINKDRLTNIKSVEILRNKDEHAEVEAIAYLKSEWKTGETQIYINWSPCDECCDKFLELTEEEKADLTITFAGFYYIDRDSCAECRHRKTEKNGYREQLKKLSSQITVKTFEEKDWVDLFQCLYWKFHREEYWKFYREEYWKNEKSFEMEDEAMRNDYEKVVNVDSATETLSQMTL